jgi:putative ABC transport system permease protein
MRSVETLRMALAALGAHKLRSALTLVGIVAGVAAIIAVMTGVSVVQSTMEKELSVLGSRTFQAQKFPPHGFNHERRDFRRIASWPPLTVDDAQLIRDKAPSVDLVGAELWRFNVSASYRGEETEQNVMICGGTPEYPENNTHYVLTGRNISTEDVEVGRRVAVIGPSLADELFPFEDPIGKIIRVEGVKLEVQGVFASKKSAFGGGFDRYVLMPITVYERVYGRRDQFGGRQSVNITVRALSPALLDSAMDESRMILRAARGLEPGQDDTFFFFTNTSQINAFNQATRGLKIAAFVLGIVALVVAGIGIMNIMLVAVTERTREIGIRKALGARRRSILLQFLTEAVVLCNIGGAIGVGLGFALGNIVTLFTDFDVTFPGDWAIYGLVFCTVVGVGFGLWPAVRASRLQPIEALRYE